MTQTDLKRPNILWGARAIAEYLGITQRQFYHRMGRGQISGVKRVGGTLTATPESLEPKLPKADTGAVE